MRRIESTHRGWRKRSTLTQILHTGLVRWPTHYATSSKFVHVVDGLKVSQCGFQIFLGSLEVREPDETSICRRQCDSNVADPPCERITLNGNSLGDSDADQVDHAWPGELVDISTTDWGRFKSKENQLSYNSFRCGKTNGFMLSSKWQLVRSTDDDDECRLLGWWRLSSNNTQTRIVTALNS